QDPTDKPSDEYMSCVRNMSMTDVPPSAADLAEAEINARRHELAKSYARFLRDTSIETLEDFDRLEEHLKTAPRGYLAERFGVPHVESPPRVHTRGAPRVKRIKSQQDVQDENARKRAMWKRNGNLSD
ncbi:hypothetical protein BGW41_003579, partial [Actinomortierella wolfii]